MYKRQPIGDTNKEPADGGAADGGGDKGGDATNPDPDSLGEGGADNNNVVSGFNGKSFLEKMAARGIIDSIDNLDIMVDDKPVDLSTITKEDDLLDIVAVSYTHLDVYKRQSYRLAVPYLP